MFGISLGKLGQVSGGLRFSPASLFPVGTAGAWYDPSDSTTLFSDTAGTTPCAAPGAGALVNVGRMLDKSGNGNHAISYNSTTARPELSARVNLLTRSEEFNDGVWNTVAINAFGSGSVVNTTATLDPLGGNTAEFIQENNVASTTHGLNTAVTLIANAVYTITCYFKAATRTFAIIGIDSAGGNGARAFFNLSTGSLGTTSTLGTGTLVSATTPVDAGNGWYRCQLTAKVDPAATSATLRLSIAEANGAATYSGNGTSGIFIWGADLRPANIGANAPAYQRIADQYTYDTVGFPRYLRFDGVDDGMSTPANLNLSATDKATVFAGVRKLSDAATGVVAELSVAASASYPGSFNIFAPNSAAATNYGFRSGGSLSVGINSGGGTYASPITNVLALNTDIGNDVLIGRINGAQVNNSTSDQGTGNFGTYPLYIGARNNASVWFNGYLYSLIVVGAAATAAQISSTESWIAGKEGITL